MSLSSLVKKAGKRLRKERGKGNARAPAARVSGRDKRARAARERPIGTPSLLPPEPFQKQQHLQTLQTALVAKAAVAIVCTLKHAT